MFHIYRQIRALKRCQGIVLTQKLENTGVFPYQPIHVVPRSPWRFLSRAWSRHLSNQPWQISTAETDQICSILEATQVDVMHIFFGSVAIHLLPLLRTLKIPAVVSFHGADVAGEMRRPDHAAAVAEVFERASAITARSSALASEILRMGCVENKVSLQRTLLPEIKGSQRMAPSNHAWKFVQIARLIPKKGMRTAVLAFADFLNRFPSSTYVIAGEGPLRDELETLVNSLGIRHAVTLPGFLSQSKLHAMLMESHVYLHPSETTRKTDQEGVPNAMLEAMASGLPVIATHHGGIPEVVRNRVDGLLVPEGNVHALTQAMEVMTSDHIAYAAMSISARKRALSEYGPQNAACMEKVYLALSGSDSK